MAWMAFTGFAATDVSSVRVTTDAGLEGFSKLPADHHEGLRNQVLGILDRHAPTDCIPVDVSVVALEERIEGLGPRPVPSRLRHLSHSRVLADTLIEDARSGWRARRAGVRDSMFGAAYPEPSFGHDAPACGLALQVSAAHAFAGSAASPSNWSGPCPPARVP